LDSYTVTMMSKTDTVKIGNTTLTNCYHFYFDDPQLADDEYSIWLAPGIGCIKTIYEGVNPIKTLVKARIHNQEINF